MRLTSIEHMRAIAILMIVVGHASYFAPADATDLASGFVKNLVQGGTTYFVFVSGYMFHHVFHDRYQFRPFMTGKFRTVAAPYLFISIPLIIWTSIRQPSLADRLFGDPMTGDPFSAVETGVRFLATGAVLPAFWYVPFIMLIFALSPLYRGFISLSSGAQKTLITLSILTAILVHRPIENLNAFQSVIYFTPAYLIGIFMSLNRDSFLRWVRGKEAYFLIAGLMLAGMQTYSGHIGNYHKPISAYGGIDLMLPQKLFLCIAFFALLERASDFRARTLEIISATSFAIFFLHMLFLKMLFKLGLATATGNAWLNVGLTSAAAVALSVACALLAKRALGARSRMLVGY